MPVFDICVKCRLNPGGFARRRRLKLGVQTPAMRQIGGREIRHCCIPTDRKNVGYASLIAAANCVGSDASAITLVGRDKTTRRANQSKPVQPLAQKYCRFPRRANQGHDSARLVPTRGALAIVTNAGRDAVDVTCAQDERA